MPLVLGTNCGFVTAAPSADPSESSYPCDNRAMATVDTAPTGATTITEIGWYCDNATEAANFQVGLYANNAGEPGSALYRSSDSAKGTGAGWKSITGLSISITAGTIYWLAFQLDDTATTTNTNYGSITGGKQRVGEGKTTLPDPFGTDYSSNNITTSIYAVYTTGGGSNIKSYNTNLYANIKTINTNAIANVKSLNTNT